MSAPQLTPEKIMEAISLRQIPTEMEIVFDALAIEKALVLWRMASDSQVQERPSLRVYIEGKGCDGFFYGVAFDQAKPEDFVFVGTSIDIVVDPQSLSFIYGSEVSWMKTDDGEGFLVKNPNHDRFRGKFYKKRAWQEVLTSPSSSQ